MSKLLSPKIRVFFERWGGLICAVFIFVLITLPAGLTDRHVLRNLEPYPDGLLYALSARNLTLGRGLQLVYEGSQIAMWVPPLYALLLSVGYVIDKTASNFYFVNLLLGVGSLAVLWYLLTQTVRQTWLRWLGMGLYISHAYLLWLPMVPMSENASLLLFLLSFVGLVQQKPTPKKLALSGIGIIGLLLTRYALLLVVAMFGIWWLSRLLQLFKSKHRMQLIAGVAALGALAVPVLFLTGTLKLHFFTSMIRELKTGGEFFSFSFIGMNVEKYWQVLLGKSSFFLWMQYPLHSVALSIFAIAGMVFGIVKNRGQDRERFILLASVWLAILPVLLIFYIFDSRYLVLTIGLFVFAVVWTLELLIKKYPEKKLLLMGLVVLLVVCQVLSQARFYKELLVTNLLHRSTAWQYESIQHFNTFAQTHPNVTIITALPPFLVDAYQKNAYHVLPLSHSQEFISKEVYVWGEGVPYQNLFGGYSEWLKEGRELYISNAYITHQQAVIQDFEQFKKQFDLELVSEGCSQACNIYKLTTKEL